VANQATNYILRQRKIVKALFATNFLTLVALGYSLHRQYNSAESGRDVEINLLKQNGITIAKEQIINSVNLSTDTLYCLPIIIK
jgi:hypothetical protein